MAKGQKKRAQKVSAGVHAGARKSPQSPLNLVHMGKGKLFAKFQAQGAKTRFVIGDPKTLFDADQARKNRELYPHLFSGGY